MFSEHPSGIVVVEAVVVVVAAQQGCWKAVQLPVVSSGAAQTPVCVRMQLPLVPNLQQGPLQGPSHVLQGAAMHLAVVEDAEAGRNSSRTQAAFMRTCTIFWVGPVKQNARVETWTVYISAFTSATRAYFVSEVESFLRAKIWVSVVVQPAQMYWCVGYAAVHTISTTHPCCNQRYCTGLFCNRSIK